MHLNNEQSIGMGSVGAARKVSPNWFILPILFWYCLESGLGTIGDFSSEQMLHNKLHS